MKKEFMEPEMRRIELNLKERIAASGEASYTPVGLGFMTRELSEGCTTFYQETQIAYSGNMIDDILQNGHALDGCVHDSTGVDMMNAILG